jgi:hypothetical protein
MKTDQTAKNPAVRTNDLNHTPRRIRLISSAASANQEIIASNLYGVRLTVLYGPSDVGKSLVLRAGVASQLEELHVHELLQVDTLNSPRCNRAPNRRRGASLLNLQRGKLEILMVASFAGASA